MSVLAIGMSRDYKQFSNATPFVPFSHNISSVIQLVPNREIIVLWQHEAELNLWNDMWARAVNTADVYVEFLKVSRTNEKDSTKLEPMTRAEVNHPGTLERQYEVADATTRHFLDGNSDLIPVLLDIRKNLERYFRDNQMGSTIKAKLSIWEDTQGSKPARRLLVLMPTKMNARDAFTSLQQFDRSWWLAQPSNVQSRICIDLELL